MNKSYDFIFVYGFSRLHPYYLNIIKYLSSNNRIGIISFDSEYVVESGRKRIAKLQETENEFLLFCQKLGAEVIHFNRDYKYPKISTMTLFVPQFSFTLDGIKMLKKRIDFRKVIGLQGFGYGSLLLDELKTIGCSKIFVYDKKIFKSVLHAEGREDLLDRFLIIEMGAPYLKYPVWDKEDFPDIDYLIALPTMLFLKNAKIKYKLIRNIYSFLLNLPPEDKVVIKLHNVKDNGNKYVKEISLRSKMLAEFSAVLLGRKGLTLSTAIFFRKILDRATILSDITPYYNFGLELFLPYVKKGVITGISTVLWHCLYNKVAVYNCDNQPFGEHLPNYNGYKNFYIPYCEDRIPFDARYYDKISDSVRKADLIQLVKKEVS